MSRWWIGTGTSIDRPAVCVVPMRRLDHQAFCDGTHSKVGFQAAEAAVTGSGDKPAT